MGRKKKRANRGKYLIIISSIIALNAIGLSYAYWTGQLEVITTLTTGSFGPVFCKDNYSINVVRDDQEDGNQGCADAFSERKKNPETLSDLKVEFLDDSQTMFITGQMEEGYTAFVNYSISNIGTIPIKYDQSQGKRSEQKDLTIQDGLKVQVTQQPQVIKPQEKILAEQGADNPKVQIQVSNDQGKQNVKNEMPEKDAKVTDVRTFELKLPFDQWNARKDEPLREGVE